MTKEQAIQIHDSGVWREWTDRQRAEFQLSEDLLCMPFDVFHESVEKALGRPVWTHEFGLNRDGLISELLGDKPAPTFEQIMEMIPAEKRIILIA